MLANPLLTSFHVIEHVIEHVMLLVLPSFLAKHPNKKGAMMGMAAEPSDSRGLRRKSQSPKV